LENPVFANGVFLYRFELPDKTTGKIMKAELECIPCIMKQAYNTAVRATDDPQLIRRILETTADYIKTIDLESTPADTSNFVYRITREITGNSDPYRQDKKRFNDLCLEKAQSLRNTIMSSEDPVRTASRLAILGNVIDLGIGFTFDLDRELGNILVRELGVDDYESFKSILSSGRKRILYLGDNAGEIVFDMLLIELLKNSHDIIYTVKRGPIINDSTMEDADYVGLSGMVRIIDTGSDGIGVKWDSVSDEFTAEYEAADLIISKGQGNFETMCETKKEIIFLLRAKCDSVAAMLGVRFNDIVFKRGPILY
jgi:uncharacterized protein with ATP-grasp and redox domains